MSARNTGVTTGRRRHGGLVVGVIGVLGELMITLGALVALFLVWHLWWTDVEARGEHEAAITALEAQWQAQSPASEAGATGADTGSQTGADATADAGSGGASGVGADGASGSGAAAPIAPPQQGDPPLVPVAPENTVWAILHVPAFDEPVTPVGEGVTREGVLNVLGAGHDPGTAMPGQVGNFALAGHRTTYGRPFHDIARLQAGDPIVLETADAFYVYTVTDHEIVTPDRVDVVAPVPGHPGQQPTERLITLTACHPMYSAAERYVVHGTLSSWTRKADGVPAELAGDGGA